MAGHLVSGISERDAVLDSQRTPTCALCCTPELDAVLCVRRLLLLFAGIYRQDNLRRACFRPVLKTVYSHLQLYTLAFEPSRIKPD